MDTSTAEDRNVEPNEIKTNDRSLADDIFEIIADATEFTAHGVAETLGETTSQSFRLALWHATERTRDELGVVFIVRSDRPGVYFRASEVQKINRAIAFHETAGRKRLRAYSILEKVDAEALPADKLVVLQRARDRVERRASFDRAEASLRQSKPQDPPVQAPPIERRRPLGKK